MQHRRRAECRSPAKIDYAMNNAFGFGVDQIASLVLGRVK
jgi:hypothetical protein